jgi:hypothetical protein
MQPGEVWGRLTVIREEGDKVQCRCECGNEGWFSRKHVRRGHTSSCGCLHRERASVAASACKHGMSRSGTYNSWSSAKARCLNPDHDSFSDYGGRGITMCARWVDSFENFLADMGERPAGMTLERREVDGPYSPENCEWANRLEQTRNRRNTIRVEYQGVIKTLGEWCEELGLKYASAHLMIKNGKSVDRAFATAQRRESAKVAA